MGSLRNARQGPKLLHDDVNWKMGSFDFSCKYLTRNSIFQTYYGVDVNAITDHVRKKALKTMIETYGQTPQQLFTFPHSPRPQRKPQTIPSSDVGSITSLNTLKFMDTDPAYSGLFSSRLTTSLSSDTGTIGSSTAGTLTGKRGLAQQTNAKCLPAVS